MQGLFDDLIPAPEGPADQPAGPGGGYFDDLKSAPQGGIEKSISIRRVPAQPPPASALPNDDGDAGPPQADMGIPAAVGVGAVNGASANFADEMLGLSSAAFKGDATGKPLLGLAKLGYEVVTGQPGEATAAYEAMRDDWRNLTAKARSQHPVATTIGEIGGGVAALPAGGTAARGTSLAIRSARGAGTGAVMGGVSGVGEGENLGDRAARGAVGTVVGGIAGGVATPIGEVVTRAVSSAWRHVNQLVRGIVRPEQEAERRVAQQVVEAQQRGGNDVVPIQEMAARQAEGQPVTVLDVAGQGGRKLARSAKNTPGADDGTQAMQGMVEDRFRSQAERTSAWLDRHTPWKNNASFDRILEASRSANAPAYRQAYAEGRAVIAAWEKANPGRDINEAFLTPELKRLASAPDIAEAFGTVGRKEGNRTIIEGFQSPRQDPFARNDRGRLTASQFENGNHAIPDLPAWDQVQRVLRAKATAASQAGDRDSARQIGLLRDQLNAELDRIVPSFQTARGTAWRGFRAEDAYEAGGNYVSSNATGREAQELSRHIAGMTPDERHLFAAGFAQELIGKVRGVGDSADVVRRIYNSPTARGRIEEALGPRLSHELEAFLHVEAVMNFGRNAVQGNSTTVAQLLSAGMAGSLGYGAITGNWDASNLAAGAAVAGGRRLMMGAQAHLANRIGQMLASNDPQVFARGVQVLARSNQLLGNLRAGVDRIAARGPGQQAGEAGGEFARSVARADDNSEPVPRPGN